MNADMAPLVSIIIPSYNHAHFLREALQSVHMQSFADWEVVVVNNYSEDDTIAVVESFADPRIRLENFHNNGVIAASRNRGIALARGRYVAFLDSDDTWHPDKLLRCLPYLDNGADLVSHGLRLIGDSEGNMYCGPQQRATFDELLDKGNCITPSATVVRKNLIESAGGFSEDPAIVTSEDYHLWLKLAKAGASMQFTKEVLGDYRIHAGNQSGAVLRHLNSVLAVVNEFMPKDVRNGMIFSLRYRRRSGLSYYGAGRAMQGNGQFVEAWKFFLRSIVCWPFNLKTYAAIFLNIARQIFDLIRRLKNKHSTIQHSGGVIGEMSDSQKCKPDSTVREEVDNKPVILVFTGYYLPGYKAGGILRNLINTVDFLCDTFEFKIVTRDRDLGDSVRYPGIEVDKWQLVGNAQVYYLSQGSETLGGIHKLIKETPHHVVFLTSYFDPLTINALINRKIRQHDCRPVIVAPFGEFAWASLSQKYFKKLIFIALARLFNLYKNVVWRVSSSYEADDLIRVINPKKDLIRIVGDLPIKIAPEKTVPSNAPDTQPESGVLKIVFLSRIAREKNLNIALMILQKVKVPVLFDIYGPAENTSYWNECQELIANLPVNVVAKYCGNVHPNQVLETFGLYDLFLFPTGGEAYGNVIAESLTAGTSVLVSTMTPWRNLEPDGLGWDIELSNINAFVEVIESVSRQSASQRLQIRNDVKKRILERLFDADVLESNRRLFSNPDQ